MFSEKFKCKVFHNQRTKICFYLLFSDYFISSVNQEDGKWTCKGRLILEYHFCTQIKNFCLKTLILLICIFILKNAVIKGLKCIFSSGCKCSSLHKFSYKQYVNIVIFGYPSLIYNLFYKNHVISHIFGLLDYFRLLNILWVRHTI